jgi:phosphoribosylformylglycinamidine synthase
VDNFCWPSVEYDRSLNPDGRYKAAQLVRSCLALKDMCLAYGMPLLSGKDSMYVDGLMRGAYGEMHRVSGLPTLLFTAVSVLPDIRRALSPEWKRPGDFIYLVGDTRPEMGGSEFYEMLGYVGLSVPEVRKEEFLAYYRLLEEAGQSEMLASAHGLYRGGLGVHLALASLAAGLGVGVDLSRVAPRSPAYASLYSESAGRFLVSIAPAHKTRLEELFRNQPLTLIGTVRSDQTVKIVRHGQVLLSASLETLKAAWERRFGSLI